MSATYQETLDYLYSRLPVFQHIGKAAYKADLNNTIALMSALGNPEKNLKCIHVGGTNGKGSVSSMLAAVFTKHGYKTGLYTSPHLIDFRERIRINGEMIPKENVIQFTEQVKPLIEEISPSFFEITVGMAFDYFRKEQVDIAIIEVGMGGRLDSTNVVSPLLSVITNIGWDHMEFLGDTLAKIAAEKAGIIKPGIPVVVGESHEETKPVFTAKASALESSLTFAGPAPDNWINDCELKGIYQKRNLGTLYSAIQVLEHSGFEFNHELISDALKNVKKISGLKGRWEIIQNNPFVVADTAHNLDGLKLTIEQFLSSQAAQYHFVLGVVNDKDLSKILPLFPEKAKYYFSKPSVMRGLPAQQLQSTAAEYGLSGDVYNDVKSAYKAALQQASQNDAIYIGGSTFVVADLLS